MILRAPTQEIWDAITKTYNFKWNNFKGWESYKNETCIDTNLQQFAPENYYKDRDYTIEDFNQEYQIY